MAFVHERCVWLGVRARTLRMVCSGQAGDGPSQCYVASMSEELTLTHGVRARTLRMVCSEQAGDGPSHSPMAFVHERCVWLGVRARTLRMVCSGQAGDGPSQGLSCFLPMWARASPDCTGGVTAFHTSGMASHL